MSERSQEGAEEKSVLAERGSASTSPAGKRAGARAHKKGAIKKNISKQRSAKSSGKAAKISSQRESVHSDDSAKNLASSRSKKEQIVTAAIKVFLSRGYAGTTLLAVAEEANVIRATIYSHFSDKEELFKAIIEELTIKRLGQDFQQQASVSEPKEFVYLLRDFVKGRKQDKQYLALLRTVIGESERFPELARMYFKTVYSHGMSVAQRYFESRQDLQVSDAQSLTAIVGGSLMAHLIQQELLRGKEIVPMDINALADTLADLITRPKKIPE